MARFGGTEERSFDVETSDIAAPDDSSREPPAPSRARPRGTVRHESHAEIMDKVLFEDDVRGGEILKGLISSAGLKAAWEKLAKRMKNLEDFTGSRRDRSTLSPEELEKVFATRKECLEIAVGEYEGRHKDHERRLAALEASAEAVLRRFEVNEKDVSEVHEELGKHWQTMGVSQQDILRVEQKDLDHHQEVLELNKLLREDMLAGQATAADALQPISDRLEYEKTFRDSLRKAMDELKDFLYSAGLQKQLEQICCDMLLQYVSQEDLKACKDEIHVRAVEAATIPVKADIKTLKASMDVQLYNLTRKDETINNDLLLLVEKCATGDRKFHDRIDDVVAQLYQRAMDSRLSEVEKRLIARDEYHEIDFTEFKELQTQKIETAYDRIQDLESNQHSHEHALEHWAEEIGNRSTKYDMMVLSSRVDKCALKEKYDVDYKEVQKTLKWQSVKLENLTFKSNFGAPTGGSTSANSPSGSVMSMATGPRAAAPKGSAGGAGKDAPSKRPSSKKQDDDDDPLFPNEKTTGHNESQSSSKSSLEAATKDAAADTAGAGEASVPAPVAAASEAQTAQQQAVQQAQQAQSHLPAAPAPPPGSGFQYQPESEMMATLCQQLESLVHCVLVLSNAALRAATCGLSREHRMERDDRLIYHVKSLLYWIMHRAAPPGWDPLELTSLAHSIEDKHKSHSLNIGFCKSVTDNEEPPSPRALARKENRRTLRKGYTSEVSNMSAAGDVSTDDDPNRKRSSEFGLSMSIGNGKRDSAAPKQRFSKGPARPHLPSADEDAPSAAPETRMRELVQQVFGDQEQPTPPGSRGSQAPVAPSSRRSGPVGPAPGSARLQGTTPDSEAPPAAVPGAGGLPPIAQSGSMSAR